MILSRHSIRLRLALAVSGLVAGLGAVSAAAAYGWLRGNLASDLEAFARHEVEEVSQVVASAQALDAGHLTTLGRLLPEEGVLSLEIWTPSGERVWGEPDPAAPYAAPWPDGFAAARSGAQPTRILRPASGPEGVRTARLLRVGGTPRWLVTATVSREPAKQTLLRFRRYAALSVLVATLLTFVGSLAVLARALQPVQDLVQRALTLSRGPAGGRLREPSPGSELGTLAALLNRLLAQTEETLARLRSFTAHVSHELRTPLTRMRVEVESALASHDPEKSHDALATVAEEIDALRRVIDALLELAQGEDPVHRDAPPLDLATLVTELCSEARLVGREQGVLVELAASCPAAVPGSRALLARLLWNLLDNAIRAAAPGGRVTLRLTRQDGDRVAVDVEDDGPGLASQDDAEALFAPFTQGREAGLRGSHGLGLALSRAIARRHGGELRWLAPGALGGARLRLELPSAPDPGRQPREGGIS